jgi:hypothetical protein
MTELSPKQRTAPADRSYVEEERDELEEQLSALTEAAAEVRRFINVLGGLYVEQHTDSEDVAEANDGAERALTTLSQAINEQVEELREQVEELSEQLDEMAE